MTTTTPTPALADLDLDKLEQLARDAANLHQGVTDYKLAGLEFEQAVRRIEPQAFLDLVALASLAAHPVAPVELARCTCPSGDGSLRWPCPQHPPEPAPERAAAPAELTAAARDVLAERRRQVEVEGWTPEHDDAHSGGQMAVAAGHYALACGYPHERDTGRGHVPNYWPWAPSWWKPRTKRENLVRAGALILADIERLDRAQQADKA